MHSEILDPGSPGWADMLAELPHDFYQLPEYVGFASEWQDRGDPAAFVATEGGHRLLIPLILRTIPTELLPASEQLFDATGPRGYPGPVSSLGNHDDSDHFVERAIADLIIRLRERLVVSAFVRLHPLLPLALSPFERAGTLVNHGWSTSVDLSLPRETLWAQTNHGHRSRINKALRLGYAGRADDSWSRFDGLIDLYQQSMARLGADPFWRLSPGYFKALRASLGSRLFLIVVEQGDELASAALFTETDGIVEYHLSGTADEHLRASPSKLLIDYARTWAKDRGNRYLHLAGSPRPDDSLAEFKAGFSPLRHEVRSWRLISDPVGYGLVQDRWQALNRAHADQPDGFFPAYRKTLEFGQMNGNDGDHEGSSS